MKKLQQEQREKDEKKEQEKLNVQQDKKGGEEGKGKGVSNENKTDLV